MKVWVRCRVCDKKIRIRKKDFDKDYYILSEGIAIIDDDKIYFYCNDHIPLIYPELAH
ncbi:MAG: hypothetical protein ACTSPY_12850 [Candidatus Helarchaeota archaeon]